MTAKKDLRWQDEPDELSIADSVLSDDDDEGGSEEEDTMECEHEKIKKSILSKKDMQAVWRLRVGVSLVLIATASAVCTLIYSITTTGDSNDFVEEYQTNAAKVVKSFDDVLIKIKIISQLAIAATSNGMDHGNKWPFITLSNFQERARAARQASDAIYVSLNPIVAAHEMEEWEQFVQDPANNYWVEEGHALQRRLGIDDLEGEENVEKTWGYADHAGIVVGGMHTFTAAGAPVLVSGLLTPSEVMLPRWQTSPVLHANLVNEDLFQKKDVGDLFREGYEKKSVVLGGFHYAPPGTTESKNPDTAFFAALRSMNEGREVFYHGDPMAHAVFPIFDNLTATKEEQKVVAMMKSTFRWKGLFENILTGYDSVTLILENECDGNFTYEIHGPSVQLVGMGDLHDPRFDKLVNVAHFTNFVLEDGTWDGLAFTQDKCPYSIRVYPTLAAQRAFRSYDPALLTMCLAATFGVLMVLFGVYDRIVDHRQNQVLHKATRSTALVASLFPKQIRDKLLGDAVKGNVKGFMNDGTVEEEDDGSPIADLYPHCTVYFCDIAGFTAWSSTREPAEVFTLLQTLYGAFDEIAKKRKVFKVETIGDSYVAVTGLPEAQPDHAVRMARFATDCLVKMGQVVNQLEDSLGPDTRDLGMRIGMHSGPVTAGVLKGDRARFQLFGDTVNTAARMESNGVKNKIQVSYSTYEALVEQGKERWLTPRDELVHAKGKGAMKTYWLSIPKKGSTRGGSSASKSSAPSVTDRLPASVTFADDFNDETEPSSNDEMAKNSRLVDWIVETLHTEMRKLASVRKKVKATNFKARNLYKSQSSIDEVADVIVRPTAYTAASKFGEIDIGREVLTELKGYVAAIADLYHENPFHSFEHACHVTMAAHKFLKRIVELPGELQGINSDPLTVLAILFSTLIHDADHRGIGNGRLIEEDAEIALKYGNQSPAEQNSLDTAWELLMHDNKFHELKECLFHSDEDLQHFRQVMVNSVMATDIFDAGLNQSRKDRWEKAFSSTPGRYGLSQKEQNELRATVIIEHIIQAADVSHTMQHWHIYRKWNQQLFEEMHGAYMAGRMDKDPSHFWYKGEIGFFDQYVIPLAKRLKECKVFGTSSEECLNYAMKNRDEWAECGEDIVEEMMQGLRQKYPNVSRPTPPSKPILDLLSGPPTQGTETMNQATSGSITSTTSSSQSTINESDQIHAPRQEVIGGRQIIDV